MFGSYAYGTPRKDSDFDFFIVLPDRGDSPKIAATKARRALAHMKRRTPVDILANTRSRFNELKELPTLERKVSRDGVLLYAAE